MSAGGRPPRWLRAAAGLCLGAYPHWFRRECGDGYRETLEHRWRTERASAGPVGAAARVLGMLLLDTATAAPRAHRDARADAPAVPGRRPLAAGAPARWWDGLATDFRLAVRALARRPGYSALVVLTLGIGIGANAALFGALDRVVLRPLPFPEGDRIVHIRERHQELGWQIPPTPEALARWREGARTLEWLESYRRETPVWTGEHGAELVQVVSVSAGLPGALGVRPVIGRIPTETELDPEAPLVMLAEGFWRREFGGDPGVLGRTLTLGERTSTIVGVWPASAWLDAVSAPDLWRVHSLESFRDGHFLMALRGKGVSTAEVQAELRALTGDLERAGQGLLPVVIPPHAILGDTYVQALWLTFGGVLLLLLVAVANTANLLLDRAVSRGGEVGVRAAVGGSSARLARLFLTESLVLTALGLLLAVMVSRAGGAALVALVPTSLPVLEGATADPRVLLYTGLLVGLVALVSVAVPAAWLRSFDVRSLLVRGDGARTGGGRGGRGRRALVAVQVGLAVVLVTGAALTLRSFQKVMAVEVGVDVERLAQISVSLPGQRYATPEARQAFWTEVLESLRALPGVSGVALSDYGPWLHGLDGRHWRFAGDAVPDERVENYMSSVSPDYFAVAGVRIVEGRTFEPSDEREIVVNRGFAERHGGGVLGRLLTPDDSVFFYRIVGVAADVAAGAPRENPDRLHYYRPFTAGGSSARAIVRTEGDAEAVLGAARERVAGIDPTLPLREATTARELLRAETARPRFLAQLLGLFGALSLLLAVMGVYGAVALDVSRRTREVGIRIALGAGASRVVREVIAAGLSPVAVGGAVGALAALWASRFLEGALYRIPATDPVSIAAGVGLLVVTATAACWIPARRAARVDPVDVLRAE